MAKILIPWLLLVFVSVPGEASAGVAKRPYELTAGEVRLMNGLTRYIGGPLHKGDEARLRRLLTAGDGPAGAFSAGLLFKHRPDRYRHIVFRAYAVRDYAQRARGRYRMIDRNELSDTMGVIEARNGGLRDRRLLLLLAFLHYRDANAWFYMRGQKLSAARVLRGAFLAAILKDTPINPLKLVNAIDRATRKAMGF